jgi:hypothetical protein
MEGEEYFPLKNREEEGYLQNLLDNGKDFKILPVFRVPSIGPTTGIQQALKALHRENYITLQKLFNRFVFLEQPLSNVDTYCGNIVITTALHRPRHQALQRVGARA